MAGSADTGRGDRLHGAERSHVVLTGVHAVVRGVLDQLRADRADGHRTAAFVSGYPGSPLAGIDLELQRVATLADELGLHHEPGLNEELAATAVHGSQLANQLPGPRYDGVMGLWYGKSPGFDRATDALRHANAMGSHPDGGALVVVGDDPAASSSSLPSSTVPGLVDCRFPVLLPADPQDVADLVRHGIALSRASGLWAGLPLVTDVADGVATVRAGVQRVRPVVPLGVDGLPHRHRVDARVLGPVGPTLDDDIDAVRLPLAREYARLNRLDEVEGAEDARLAVVAAGKPWLDVLEALALLGLGPGEQRRLGLRLARVRMPWPLDPDLVRRAAAGVAEVVVVEERGPLVEHQVKDVLYGRAGAPAVHGRRTPTGEALLPARRPLTPDAVARALVDRLEAVVGTAAPGSDQAALVARARERTPRKPRTRISVVPARTPTFCSGCPHSTSTAVPEGTVVGAGVGCHGMVLLMDDSRVGEITGLTQMGGEGAQWIGASPFTSLPHMVQNMGDGTYAHSGSLAVRAAVAAGVDITFKLLHNGSIAMTGGQDAPGSRSLADTVAALRAEGVAEIVITSDQPDELRHLAAGDAVRVWHRDRLDEAQARLADVAGTTVILHVQECAADLLRRRRRGQAADAPRRVVINERLCEGCGDCGHVSGCLSVQPVATDFGRKTRIHQGSCTVDESCLHGDCPAFVTVVPGPRPARAPGRPTAADRRPIPDPPAEPAPDQLRIRIAGVGGTGVVTVSRILAEAAAAEGWAVRGVDQTGLAQKGGPVISDLVLDRAGGRGAARLAPGTGDVLLGCDLLVAADDTTLGICTPTRTAAVLSTTVSPTHEMVVDVHAATPDAAVLEAAVAERCRPGAVRALDAGAAARAATGSDQVANLVLVGQAVQEGWIALAPGAVEAAIAANGAAVAANVEAFRTGRRIAAGRPDPATAPSSGETVGRSPDGSPRTGKLIGAVGAEPGSGLHEVLAVRVPELVAYQDVAYARRYVDRIVRLKRAEDAVAEAVGLAPSERPATEAAARSLYHLMASKDEYEVARLARHPSLLADIAVTGADPGTITYHLHPPSLRRLRRRAGKVEVPQGRARPLFAALRASRRVRGTALDPFRANPVRRLERDLRDEWEAVVDEVVGLLTPASHAAAAELLALPLQVRGFEDLKVRRAAEYREALARARADLVRAAEA